MAKVNERRAEMLNRLRDGNGKMQRNRVRVTGSRCNLDGRREVGQIHRRRDQNGGSAKGDAERRDYPNPLRHLHSDCAEPNLVAGPRLQCCT